MQDLTPGAQAVSHSMDDTRLLTPADGPPLDALFQGGGLAGAYARGHIRLRGLGPGGVRAWGWPAIGPIRAALAVREGIAWTVWGDGAACDALAARLARLDVHLLSGPPEMARPVLAALPGGGGWQDRCPLAVLHPTAFVPPPGMARHATAADLEALIEFYRHGFYSLAQLPTRAAWRARLSEQLMARTTYISEAEGQIVAAAQSSAETPDCAMIGGVATLPAYRKQGRSQACVGALCAHLFAAGCQQIGLFYMPGNEAAAHVYARLGFQIVGEWWLTRLIGGWESTE